MFRDRSLQFSDISFDPPLYSKRARQFKVILIHEQGQLLHGITVKLRKGQSPEVKVPDVLKYQNSDRASLPLSQLTKETLKERILERVGERKKPTVEDVTRD